MKLFEGKIDGKFHKILINDNNPFTTERVELPDDAPELIEAFNEYNRAEELKGLRKFLESTDYVACKIAEGVSTKEEYSDVLMERQKARLRINELEAR